MTRKTTLLLIFALTLITLLVSFSTAGASGSVAADELVGLPQVTTSTESDEPEIKDIEPDEGEPGQTLDVAITGENTHFNVTSEVSFSAGIAVNSTTVHGATSLTVTITIAADAPVGKQDVTVTTVITDGVTEVITKEHGFEVEAADEPEIKDIEPDEGKPGQTLDVVITGENTHFNAAAFTQKPTDISAATFALSSVATGTAVSFSPPNGITVNSTTVHDATSLTVNITIADDAPVGKRDVTVTTVITDGVTEVVTKEDGFEVEGDDEREKVEFEGTIINIAITPGSDPITGTITVEIGDDEDDTETLAAVTATTWTVHINVDTRIRIGPGPDGEGTIADLVVGQQVEVEGILQDDGSVLARKIHVEHDDDDDDQVGFRGTIEAKSGVTLTVQMGSYTLTVVTDGNTKIEGADDQSITFDDLEVGQQIKGKGVLQEDGSILASEIEVEDDHGPDHERVRFEGVITGLPDGGLVGEWTVRTSAAMTVTFSVDVDTKIKPPGVRPEVGDWAKITAVRQEGDPPLLALKVHLKKKHEEHPRPVEFRGTIVEMEGNPPTRIVVNIWGNNEYADVAGALVDVLIDNLTHIEGELMVGVHVKVRGFLQNDGSVLARRIEVEDDDDDEDEVEFKGRIQHIEDGMWVVGGFTVLITDTTVITGTTPQVGLLAEVKGARVGPRTVRATNIEVEDPSDGNEQVKVRGVISEGGLPETDNYIGTWTITTEDGGSVLIEVTLDTVIDTEHGEVRVGALVRVTALRQDDGTLVAQRIKVFESD